MPVAIGGDNLLSLVRIGLTDLPLDLMTISTKVKVSTMLQPIIKATCSDCLIIEFVLMCSKYKYIHTKAAAAAAAATSLNGVSLYHQ